MKRIVLLFALLLSTVICQATVLNTKQDSPDGTFSVIISVDGITTVKRIADATTWDIEYGPSGFADGTGILIDHIGYISQSFLLNPFVSYEFRIRVRNLFGSESPWSERLTTSSCSTTETIGYSFDFNSSMIDACWRGYFSPPNLSGGHIFQVDYQNHGDSGSAIQMATSFYNNYPTYLISPKLNSLGTDKKISLWVKNYNGYNLKVGTVSSPYDPSTFHALESIPSQGSNFDEWEKKTIYLNNYNGTDQYIMISYSGSYLSTDSVLIDDFSYEQSVNCFPVENLIISNIDEHTAQFDFLAPDQNLWQVELTNLLTEEIQTYTINSNTGELQNLVGNTNYKIRIRAVCEEDHYGNWTTPVNFTTICNVITAPYNTSFGDAAILDPCWKSITANIGTVVMAVSSTTYGSNSILYPRTGSKMIEMINTFVQPSNKTYLISPYLADLDATKRLKFHLISRNTHNYPLSSLTIGTMSDPEDSDTFQPIKTFTASEMSELNSNPIWKEHTVYFNNYTGTDAHYIAFKQGNADSSDFLIDDISYENIPECVEPLSPAQQHTEYNSATVKWEDFENSNATEWEIEYGLQGFVQGTGTTVLANSNPFTINNLTEDDTVYSFYLRSKCGNSYSNWSDVGTFKTKCVGITIGTNDSFENQNIGGISACWTGLFPNYNENEYYDNSSIAVVSSSGNPTHTGNKSVQLVYNDGADPIIAEKRILVTPRLIDFNNFKKISFWVYTPYNNYGSAKKIIVGTLSNPDDYTTFTSFYTITDAVTYNNTWHKYTIDFSGYTGTDQYVGIRQGFENVYQFIYIDDFEYSGITCPTPTALQASQSGTNSVKLQWNVNNTVSPPTSWEIEYGISGFTPGSGTVITADSNPYNLQGLGSYDTFEFRVKNSCAVGQASDWSEKYPFRISCTATAPFEDNFEQYDYDQYVSNPNIFCWTSPDRSTSNLSHGCTINECNNDILLLNSVYPFPESTGAITSPYLPDFDNTKSITFLISNGMNEQNQQSVSDIIIGTITNPMDFSTFVPYQTVDLHNIPLSGKEFNIDFSNYTGTAKHIAFLHGGVYGYNYIHIDNFRYFDTNLNCPEPINILTENINSNSAAVVWDAQNGAESFQIEYGIPGFTVGTGTIVTSTTNEAQITNLMPTTTYEYYIKANCASGLSSTIAGPKTFTTACTTLSVPWIENFNTMPEYGTNILPECFKMNTGVITSSQNAIPTAINFDQLLTGVGDTYFLRIANEFSSSMFTPQFSLNAGTTYSFSMMVRKGYQYSFETISCQTGRGITLDLMKTKLSPIGTLQEYAYSSYKFIFTPITSGDYSFFLLFESSGSFKGVMDQFQLTEAYADSVTSDTESFDFETTLPDTVILESTSNSEVSIQEQTTGTSSLSFTTANHFLKMEGSTNVSTWNTTTNDLWLANEDNITKVNMKIDAGSMSHLFLYFDLKQTYNTTNQESMFRLIVNGNILGEVIHPTSQNQDSYNSHVYDLTPYVGSDIRISLQHIGKSAAGIGDNAYFDNLKFSDQLLSQLDFSTNNIKIYPNPVKNNLTITNSTPISEVTLINISGQSLFHSSYNTGEVKIDMSKYEAGVYFIRINTDNKIKTFKIIRQ